jgi:hypothetical protein
VVQQSAGLKTTELGVFYRERGLYPLQVGRMNALASEIGVAATTIIRLARTD